MKKLFTLFVVLLTAYYAKAGAFGMGDYRWSADDSPSGTELAKNTPLMKDDNSAVRLRMSIGQWFYSTGSISGTFVLQYALYDANDGNDPNNSTSWTTVGPGTDWDLATSNYLTGSGSQSASPTLTSFSQTGFYPLHTGSPSNGTFEGIKYITSSTGNATTLSKAESAAGTDYIRGELEYAIKPTSTTQKNTTYSFRLHATNYSWSGGGASGGDGTGDQRLLNLYSYTESISGGLGGGQTPKLDYSWPKIKTGANIDKPVTSPVMWQSPGLQYTIKNGQVALTWATATEINNKQFNIQRSADNGKTYQTIGTRASQAIDGNSNSVLTYSFTDASPIANAVYRIQQVDKDGTGNSYSNSVNVSLAGNATLSVYPSPVTTTLNVKGATAGDVYRIVSIAGVTVTAGTINAANTVSVSNIASGTYILQVKLANGTTQSVTFIKK